MPRFVLYTDLKATSSPIGSTSTRSRDHRTKFAHVTPKPGVHLVNAGSTLTMLRMIFCAPGHAEAKAVAGVASRSQRRLKKVTPQAILDLYDPKVDVESDFPFEPLIGSGGFDPVGCVEAREATIATLYFALWRRTVKRAAPIEPIDLDENSPGLGRAASAQHGTHAFDPAAAQIRRDPEIASQSHDQPVFAEMLPKIFILHPGRAGAETPTQTKLKQCAPNPRPLCLSQKCNRLRLGLTPR